MQIGLEKNVRKLRRHLTCSVTQLSPLYSKAKLSLIRQEERRRQWHPTLVLLPGKSIDGGAWWAAVHGVTKSRTRLSDFTFTFHFCALEKEMATHSSILAWRILGTGEPGGLPSMGSHRVGHDWSDLAAAADKRKIHLPPLSVHWVSIEFKSTQQDSLTVLPKLTANQEQKQRFLAAKNSFAAFAFLSFLPLDLKDEAQVRSRANKCMAHNHALRSEIPALGACARKLPRGCMVRLSMELLQVVASIPHVWKWYT